MQSRLPPAGTPLLELYPCAGFANRLRAIVSGMCAAEDTSRSLLIHWVRQPGICSLRVQDVFDIDAFPSWVYVNEGSVSGSAFQQKECLSPADWEKTKSFNPNVSIVIKSYGHFHQSDPERWSRHLRALPFRAYLASAVSQALTPLHLASSVVGVHLRRGDNVKAIAESPTEAFFPILDALPPTTGFVVASDDDGERKVLAAKYPGRVTSVARTLDRTTSLGGIDAILDFLALARCSQIFGTAASSFSELAAAYGGCPLTVVRAPGPTPNV
jgi:hypothetical protein